VLWWKPQTFLAAQIHLGLWGYASFEHVMNTRKHSPTRSWPWGPDDDRMCLSEHHQQFFGKIWNQAKGRETRQNERNAQKWCFCICLNLGPLADFRSSIKQTLRVSVWCSHGSIASSFHMVLLQVLGSSIFTWFYRKF
jgi:hypothetical protein